jgi:ABC-type transport system involved in multi-copper enzyme maturation permease subunit
VTRLAEFREVLWRSVFIFMIQVQLFWVMVLVARVGPGLIANDIKARALPIYFARPITPSTYLLGKWMVAATFIGLVTVAPNLAALIFGVLLTGGLQTWGQTLGLGLDLLVCGAGVMVFGGMLILALSSTTADSRYVSVGWLAVCLLPVMAQAIVSDALDPAQTTGLLGSISLRDNLMNLTKWVFDLRDAWASTPLPAGAYEQALGNPVKTIYPAIVLGGITVAAAVFCYRRVLRFSQAAANV